MVPCPSKETFLIFFASYMEVPPTVAQDAMLQPQTEKNYQPHPYQGKLEPDDGQLSRPVLRGLGFGNEARLPA